MYFTLIAKIYSRLGHSKIGKVNRKKLKVLHYVAQDTVCEEPFKRKMQCDVIPDAS